LDTKSKQPKKGVLHEGASLDYSVQVFGVNLLNGWNGALVEPGTNLLSGWWNFLYTNMLNVSNDNKLLSKDKND